MAGRTVKKDDKAGTWYYTLTYGKNEKGKPKQYKKRGFRTKQTALQAMNELEHSLMNETYIKPNKTLYKEYMTEQWLEDKQTKVKRQTLETYRWLVTKHVIPVLGSIELSKMRPEQIQGLYNKLTRDKNLSDENIQKVHTLINDSLKKTERWGLIQKNPAALVDRPKSARKEINVWNIDEVKRFLNHPDNDSRYSIAFLLALTSGMRQGEILGLRWKDVDFENGLVRITQTLSSDGKEIQPYTKTKAGARTINLPKGTMNALKKHKKKIQVEREEDRAGEYVNLDLVVCSQNGTPTNKSNIRRAFERAIKLSKVKRIKFHGMRHTHATMLLIQGVNPKVVSERLGHSTVRMTLDVYSHLLPSMQRETADQLGKTLFDE
ncbi:tyrosine-type recombinase/integrase [Saccharibacillus brassicae]|uniref:Site-specific integrase n=1 Tax=Saccharibacillus brassicae TaxID=2583377 RepID=A0A4Y6URW9_SACBS|nr:tyrosine-type recombinase/integrase [Saccharibacillus brassicae]QDH19794.1 site-specific integrase [Saccharibacillus brassicae]